MADDVPTPTPGGSLIEVYRKSITDLVLVNNNQRKVINTLLSWCDMVQDQNAVRSRQTLHIDIIRRILTGGPIAPAGLTTHSEQP